MAWIHRAAIVALLASSTILGIVTFRQHHALARAEDRVRELERAPTEVAEGERNSTAGGEDGASGDHIRRVRLTRESASDESVSALVARLRDDADSSGAIRRLVENCEPEVRDQLAQAWSRLDPRVQSRLLQTFFFERHPFAFDLLELGLSSGETSVRATAGALLRTIAFVDFCANPERYAVWRASTRGMSFAETVAWSARSFVEEIGVASAFDLDLMLETATKDHDSPTRLKNAGIMAILGTRLDAGPIETRRQALKASARLRPDEVFLRRHVIPMLENPGLRHEAIQTLGVRGNSWAIPHLTPFFESDLSECFAAAHAVGRIGDASAIPDLIEVIRRDNSYKSIYGVGHFALGTLTGVAWSETHDAAWWDEWWAQNRSRYGK